ncbi:hypothetical protein X777_15585 [Ooceraea biroi]|uniref:Uncharacterized protein n=1 Tax=Ooceraea biroi TaxID=2015173 RepID=A0A026VUI1_OOCBI|nr:hypothetical protein X777_15585 [Ooceraea biroi]
MDAFHGGGGGSAAATTFPFYKTYILTETAERSLLANVSSRIHEKTGKTRFTQASEIKPGKRERRRMDEARDRRRRDTKPSDRQETKDSTRQIKRDASRQEETEGGGRTDQAGLLYGVVSEHGYPVSTAAVMVIAPSRAIPLAPMQFTRSITPY